MSLESLGQFYTMLSQNPELQKELKTENVVDSSKLKQERVASFVNAMIELGRKNGYIFNRSEFFEVLNALFAEEISINNVSNQEFGWSIADYFLASGMDFKGAELRIKKWISINRKILELFLELARKQGFNLEQEKMIITAICNLKAGYLSKTVFADYFNNYDDYKIDWTSSDELEKVMKINRENEKILDQLIGKIDVSDYISLETKNYSLCSYLFKELYGLEESQKFTLFCRAELTPLQEAILLDLIRNREFGYNLKTAAQRMNLLEEELKQEMNQLHEKLDTVNQYMSLADKRVGLFGKFPDQSELGCGLYEIWEYIWGQGNVDKKH